jgi:hypothetical protein
LRMKIALIAFGVIVATTAAAYAACACGLF